MQGLRTPAPAGAWYAPPRARPADSPLWRVGRGARGTGSTASPSFGTTLECGRLEAGQNCGHLEDRIYRGPLPTVAGGLSPARYAS